MSRQRYCRSTIKTYSEALLTFIRFIRPKKFTDTMEGEADRFITDYILKRELSPSYQNQFISAFKLFYGEVLHRTVIIEQIRRPRQGLKLPNVLNKQEVKLILHATKNLKHRAILSLTYACGLRRGEVLRLKPLDIDSERGLLKIMNGKGNKDRIVPISGKIIGLLREYYQQYRPKTWLFEGICPGNQYDERSFEQVLKNSLLLAKIKKPVTLHWLRHSYATHLHESGVDIRFIQILLGHKSSKTTEIYTHVSRKSLQQIRCPFDDL
ncbi:MAG: tyrosine-type recombinase/integrase [bacterium]